MCCLLGYNSAKVGLFAQLWPSTEPVPSLPCRLINNNNWKVRGKRQDRTGLLKESIEKAFAAIVQLRIVISHVCKKDLVTSGPFLKVKDQIESRTIYFLDFHWKMTPDRSQVVDALTEEGECPEDGEH